jgi:D-beta-D-heptose 7-phosphate kinase / D-beta-D-heptose 1-phosphate adenosyltransferase
MNDEALLDILASFHRARVLVCGDVMLDRFVYGSVERTSPEAPVPVMALERTSNMPGGAANVARNVAALGSHAVLIGVVGADEAADELRRDLSLVPLQTQLIVDPSRPTTTKTRYVADRQQILRTDVELAAPLTEAVAASLLAQFTAALSEADIVVLSDYGKGALSDSVTARAIAAANAAGKRVLVDPKSRSFLKYKGATVLTPNKHELQSACGHDCSSDEQVEAAARQILAQGICSIVVATRGKEGMSIVQPGASALHIRTVASEVYDVTGAGDTAVAAMAVGLAGGADISNVARLANIAAGIVVGKYGTATASPDEILARLRSEEDSGTSESSFTLERTQLLVARWRRLGARVAFTNGCFDMLHPGHVSLLNQAKRAADRLVVGLNSDKSVRRLKGAGRPVQNAGARAMVLSSLKAVDAVVIFDEDTPLGLITALEPDVLVKGADYTVETVVGADLVLKRGGKIVLAELVPAHSTTETIRRITASAKA